ncbi:MAG: hypothetical protein ABR567_11265 [Myxococcales bacterium]
MRQCCVGFDEPDALSVPLPLAPVLVGEVVPVAGALVPALRPVDVPDVVCELPFKPFEMPAPGLTPPSRTAFARGITAPPLRPCGAELF